MRLSLRFILPLFIILSIIAYSVIPIVDNLTLKWFSKDTDQRAQLITNTAQENINDLIEQNDIGKIKKTLNNLASDDKIYAISFCAFDGKSIYKSNYFPNSIKCINNDSSEDIKNETEYINNIPVRISYSPIKNNSKIMGHLYIIHDMSFAVNRNKSTKIYMFYFFIILSLIIATVTVIIAKLSLKGWMNGLRSVIKGNGIFDNSQKEVPPEFNYIIKDLRSLIRNLQSEKKFRDENNITWNAKSLKEILNKELSGNEVIIVSNREPYMHTLIDNKIVVQSPASGLVTALEPIMRACSGTWVAHGSGTADKLVVDKHDHVQVPPENPTYQIRRIWLSKEEEEDYYYGFSNEGLWPLCHIAHMQPIFKMKYWDAYKKVNKKFADAVVEESKTTNPVILIQDYHFALLPKLIKEKIPNATIITFWHIPWPNAETFGICPWREEILEGLLASNIVGFHIQYHCNNFIDCVDRYLECRIDREYNNVVSSGKVTEINPYPISIEWPNLLVNNVKSIDECCKYIRETNQLPLDHKIGIGVERLDYTKGILERFLAVERFLELNPKWIGKFTFIQIAAPSRSKIEQYHEFELKVRTCASRINEKFKNNIAEPILLKVEHHSSELVYQYYRASDFCFVSSLHDGMNLVAKEYIASRDNELGALILSQFTGASRELAEAIIVNPYDIEECAKAIHICLTMDVMEQKQRMSSMRGFIKEYNIYRWAGRMLLDAAVIRRRNFLQSKISTKNF